MTTNHHRIDYIEFNVTDIARSKSFYGHVFCWSFTDYGPSYCEFADGRLTGGFALSDTVNASGGALVVLYSEDLEATLAAIKEHEGTIAREPFDFPGGRRFHFRDLDGYELAVWARA